MKLFLKRRKIVLALAVLVSALLSGCGGGGASSPAGPPDTTPPAEVAGLAAAQDDGRITLSWSAPDSADYKGVLVRRGTNGFPDDPTAPITNSDMVVYKGKGPSYTDTAPRHRTRYYYGAFSYDGASNYSAAAFVSAESVYATFTFIAIPDTQYMSLDYPALFTTVTQWIADNKDAENIVFVLHEGDITDQNTDAEWINAAASMSILDGKEPYALAIGNHDVGATSTSTQQFNKFFPLSKYSWLPTFGGVYEAGKLDNSFHLFSAGGTDWMVVSLEYNPRDGALDWACGVVEARPERRVVVVTHAYLDGSNKRTGVGENIWNKFVKKYENITFVFNGHYLNGEGGRLVSDGDNGNKVYQMFANYQNRFFGGMGLIRIVKLNPDTKKVSVKTFSAWQKFYETDPDNEFEFEDVDFGPTQ